MRKDYLLNYHRKQRDCMIIAEAEAANMDFLLTYDKKLLTNLLQRLKDYKTF
jgi:predicted nucleic acid-binding protein